MILLFETHSCDGDLGCMVWESWVPRLSISRAEITGLRHCARLLEIAWKAKEKEEGWTERCVTIYQMWRNIFKNPLKPPERPSCNKDYSEGEINDYGISVKIEYLAHNVFHGDRTEYAKLNERQFARQTSKFVSHLYACCSWAQGRRGCL